MVKEINEYSGVVIAVISLWVVYKLIHHKHNELFEGNTNKQSELSQPKIIGEELPPAPGPSPNDINNGEWSISNWFYSLFDNSDEVNNEDLKEGKYMEVGSQFIVPEEKGILDKVKDIIMNLF
tara:strand:- start:367 stop:735 length:369 start_codon:yes stop_codon:yes gene_type:complete